MGGLVPTGASPSGAAVAQMLQGSMGVLSTAGTARSN